ncbi:Hydrolase family protein [Elusimicrobium minutum Pei191]|uniref:Endoribonuclease YbeY n=1 Tax=Elusimicrobium minutum (strain Pei191) TaxID=445932 RepID=YBEY_ELUMP|nr:rRNA maturation RNase YbeY [Elusimicrobium minutum]B2KAT6.1 RecName: Full=Endoribonuclease YbeY [Elusimicrobium minutum Pei191]ACC97632.1 Hydrolase family protein [Elusimicrobium minutum Pei191]
MIINVFYKTKVPSHFRKTSLFKAGVSAALGKFASKKGEVNLIFVDGKEIHKINKEFLNHDYKTDVISFNYPFPQKGGEGLPFGDIFVCYDVAKENASLYGQGVLKEMLTYAVHGALHLAGMDDATPKERSAMDDETGRIILKI